MSARPSPSPSPSSIKIVESTDNEIKKNSVSNIKNKIYNHDTFVYDYENDEDEDDDFNWFLTNNPRLRIQLEPKQPSTLNKIWSNTFGWVEPFNQAVGSMTQKALNATTSGINHGIDQIGVSISNAGKFSQSIGDRVSDWANNKQKNGTSSTNNKNNSNKNKRSNNSKQQQ